MNGKYLHKNVNKNKYITENTVMKRTYHFLCRVECSMPSNFCYAVPTTVVIHSSLKTSAFSSYDSRCSNWRPAFFSFLIPSTYVSFHTFISESDCTLLQCFYKGCMQSNQQLALSRLMHSIHCGSAIFPYQALERRPAQETLVGWAGLYNKKLEGIEHSPWKCSATSHCAS
jgi:hypothetical protein